MEAAREDDPELTELREFVGLWREHIGITDPTAGRDPITAKDLVKKAESRLPTKHGEPTDHAFPELRDALLLIAGGRGEISTKRLGKWLLSKEGRIVGGIAIRRISAGHDNVARWGIYAAGPQRQAANACPF